MRGLKRISGLKSAKHKDLILTMTPVDGTAEHSRQGIADIFADFYEELYKHTDTKPTIEQHTPCNT